MFSRIKFSKCTSSWTMHDAIGRFIPSISSQPLRSLCNSNDLQLSIIEHGMLQPWLREVGSGAYAESVFEWAVNNEHIPLLCLTEHIFHNQPLRHPPSSLRILRNGRLAIHHELLKGLYTLSSIFDVLVPRKIPRMWR